MVYQVYSRGGIRTHTRVTPHGILSLICTLHFPIVPYDNTLFYSLDGLRPVA